VGDLPATLPRAAPFDAFIGDPLNFLAEARAAHGDLFVLRESGAIFSRAADGAGVVAAFGLEHQRSVLTDLDAFGMPVSAAHQLNLGANLVNLNRGLHSLAPEEHNTQKRLLAVLMTECADLEQRAVAAAVEAAGARWKTGGTIHLLDEMRRLTHAAACRMMFGTQADTMSDLAARMAAYFHLRREASSPVNTGGAVSIDELTDLGDAVDAELRDYVRMCRATRASDGLLAALALAESGPAALLPEDNVIGHANVLFVSATEPVAVTLTWVFLLLSQMPNLRRALRADRSLVDSVVDETLRLLPPNAFMVRTTTRPVALGETMLPANCEIVLCPFVSHRDPQYFRHPDHFMLDRWRERPPSPFVYFPFGAGGHACVGRAVALSAIRAAVNGLLTSYDLVLAGDQDVDWRLHIIFMPRLDPEIAVELANSSVPTRAGTLRGPIAGLLHLDN
jgi:cytochrome P450